MAHDEDVVLYEIPVAGKRLGGASPNHVYRLISAGVLRAVDIATPGSGRTKLRVRSDDLAAYIAACTQPAEQVQKSA